MSCNFLGFNVVRIGSGPWCTLTAAPSGRSFPFFFGMYARRTGANPS
jgi:hypothetical protein